MKLILTTKELAELIRVHVNTIYALKRKGLIKPRFKRGFKSFFWTADECKKAIDLIYLERRHNRTELSNKMEL